jgi:hypothetical protein
LKNTFSKEQDTKSAYKKTVGFLHTNNNLRKATSFTIASKKNLGNWKILKKMNKFLDTYDHLILNQEDINHLKRSIMCNEIEAAIKNFPKMESPESDRFSAEFYQTFKDLISTLLILFHEIEREGTMLNSFYKALITLFPKTDKETSKKEKNRPISLMNINAKILNKIMANQIQQRIRKIIYHDQVGFIPGMV